MANPLRRADVRLLAFNFARLNCKCFHRTAVVSRWLDMLRGKWNKSSERQNELLRKGSMKETVKNHEEPNRAPSCSSLVNCNCPSLLRLNRIGYLAQGSRYYKKTTTVYNDMPFVVAVSSLSEDAGE